MKEEWKKIFQSKWIAVVLVAIITIPSIYACVFLGSLWDTYGNTGNLPVAVVNDDKSVTYQKKELHVGNDLVKKLKENKSFDFLFTSQKEAKKGLEDGKYYMIIAIPEDFSKNATTLLDTNPKKMKLHYTTNPGANFIASKMGDTAVTKIKEQVSAEVTKSYAETVFDQIGTVSNGFMNAGNGANELSQGVGKLADGNKTIAENLQKLATSSLAFEDGATTLHKGIQTYTNGVTTAYQGATTLNGGLQTLQQKSGVLKNGVDQLMQGASTLEQGIMAYTGGVSTAQQGTQQLVTNSAPLLNGISTLASGTKQLHSGSSSIVTGQENLSSGMTTINQSINGYVTFYQMLAANEQTKAYATELLQNGLSKEVVMQLTGGKQAIALPSAQGLLQQVNSSITTMQTGINQQLLPGARKLQTGLDQLETSITTSLQPGLQQYTGAVSTLNDGLQQMNNNSQALVTGSNRLTSGIGSLSQQTPILITGIDSLASGSKSLQQGMQTLNNSNGQLVNGMSTLSNGASQMGQGAGQLAQGSTTLGSGLETAKTGVNTLRDGLLDGATQSKIDTTNKTLSMLSSPVTTVHDEISTSKNNGHAMAPYMMSVALYVAGISFSMIYPLVEKKIKNAFQYWLSKSSVMYMVSTVGAIVMVTSMLIFNGFEPEHLVSTYLFAILVAAAFMSLITLIAMALGKVGSFLLLIFMVINLGSSAGTYPTETLGPISKILHPFVPYTYSVDGFRKLIGMSNMSIMYETVIFIIMFIVCSSLTFLYLKRKEKGEQLIAK